MATPWGFKSPRPHHAVFPDRLAPWDFIGTAYGFGDTAFAADLVVDKTGTLNPEEIFNQSVYQFASTRAASSFYANVNAKYRSCRAVSGSDGSGGTLRRTLQGRASALVTVEPATEPRSAEIRCGIARGLLWLPATIPRRSHTGPLTIGQHTGLRFRPV